METPSPVEELVFSPNKSLKVQAQRKFAQGCGPATCFTPLKCPPVSDLQVSDLTPRKDAPEVDVSTLPATEDFLDFLCYRETRLYQPKFDAFLKLKEVKLWQPGNEDQAKEDSEDTEDEPLIKFKPEKKEEVRREIACRPAVGAISTRRNRTKTFSLLSTRKKKKVLPRKPLAVSSTRPRMVSLSSSEESLSSHVKSVAEADSESRPKKRFPMLRPVALGISRSSEELVAAKTKRETSVVKDSATRALRSGKSLDSLPERRAKRVKALYETEGDSDTSVDSKPVRSKQKAFEANKEILKPQVFSTEQNRTAPPKRPSNNVEPRDRKKSEDLPLIRLKRIKVTETCDLKTPVERRTLRAPPLPASPARPRRGSMPIAQSQREPETGYDESDSRPIEKKTPKIEQKFSALAKEKLPQKNTRPKKSASFFERLNAQGFVDGTKLNIYEDNQSFQPSEMQEAPVFRPTEAEFNNPFEYIKKISLKAEKFGICKVIPPASFRPACVLNDDLRFVGYKQHVHKLFDRFGPNVKEYSAIRRHLLTQGIDSSQIPTIAGLELDLPMLSAAVAANGGLSAVIEEKKWSAVSDFLRAPKWAQDRSSRLDELYIKYLLAYDLLTPEEREKFYLEAETAKENRFRKRLRNEPVEVGDDPLQEKDECTIKGRSLSLKDFKRLARNASAMLTLDSDDCDSIESRFWRLVETQLQHTCVLMGSVDAGETGCGFPTAKSAFAKHPWNPKVFTSSSESVLRSMPTVIGVTAPILHFGMVFSACCWFRDPHGLPWIEFMHSGSPRVWYGLSVEQEPAFRDAVQRLWPGFIQNKRVWLPSDAVMISPRALQEQGIKLSRTVQQPGEFIVVFPRAFTNSVSTGYNVSESAYFAPLSWLKSAPQVFADARESSEPTMFSLDKLLVSMVQDQRLGSETLQEIEPLVTQSVKTELAERAALEKLRVKKISKEELAGKTRSGPVPSETSTWECDLCRVSLYYSRVYRESDDTSFCLKHAVENLSTRRREVPSFIHIVAFTEDDLQNVVDQVKSRLVKRSKK